MLQISNLPHLDKLYQRYGYEVKKKLNYDNIRVYTLNKGVYFGADIVELKEDKESTQKLFAELSKAGYACRLRKYSNIREAEEMLFDAFFHSDTLKERLLNKYNAFVNSQNQLLRSQYQYITVPYLVDDQTKITKINIIDQLVRKIDEDGPQLIIIEAAAGFGKTCTSFEIISHLSRYRQDKSPIFTELSKDRKASKFKHILQDVILTEFHSLLNEELVIHEVQRGRIPLVIDGFDELLSKEQDKAGRDDFEQVETMLSTIGDLLKENAKIILTGRKTAIFSGDSFKQWIDESPNEFTVTRFLINPPVLEDWLDEEKLKVITERNIPIKDISNPVLLAFLRSLSIGEFTEAASNPEKIVDRYFETILDREQVRQELRLEPKRQLQVFRNLARTMMIFDITADTKDWIKILIEDQNRALLEVVRKSYPLAQRPTTEELTNTLSNHALLDRKGGDGKIGFINDFIFGTLIAESILELSNEDLDEISNHMFEIAITSFQFQTMARKQNLWDKIKDLKKFDDQEKLNFEYLLTGTIKKVFEQSSFNDLSLTTLCFDSSNQFNKCVFANCSFRQVIFDSSSFLETSFVNCNFLECEILHDSASGEITNRILIIGGSDYDSGFIKNYQDLRLPTTEIVISEDLHKILFKKFFHVGTQRSRKEKVSYLINEFEASERPNVSDELEELRRKNYLRTNGDNIELTEEGKAYALNIIHS